MPVKNDDSFWERTINSLDIPVLETGEESPIMESLPTSKTKKASEGARKVLVQKLTTRVYVFTDIDGKVYTSHTAQNMQILGTMTLEKGLKVAQEDTFS